MYLRRLARHVFRWISTSSLRDIWNKVQNGEPLELIKSILDKFILTLCSENQWSPLNNLPVIPAVISLNFITTEAASFSCLWAGMEIYLCVTNPHLSTSSAGSARTMQTNILHGCSSSLPLPGGGNRERVSSFVLTCIRTTWVQNY